eukprot:NODE_613_length_5985_cov_0.176351.p5 type:complete len:106 gc:universal NODE_613_length_5985_cov_0.176351:5556-5239(-)
MFFHCGSSNDGRFFGRISSDCGKFFGNIRSDCVILFGSIKFGNSSLFVHTEVFCTNTEIRHLHVIKYKRKTEEDENGYRLMYYKIFSSANQPSSFKRDTASAFSY